jgi:hypothetical protein
VWRWGDELGPMVRIMTLAGAEQEGSIYHCTSGNDGASMFEGKSAFSKALA